LSRFVLAALAASALVAPASAQASTSSCDAPGTIKGVHVFSVSQSGVGCAAALHGVRHYLEQGHSPSGYACKTTLHGTRDVRLTCNKIVGDGTFHAAWRAH
jgi:hypothetical protein